MAKQNRGPYILAAGAGVQLLTGIPAAWGVFQRPVMQGYGFSRGQAMLAFALLVAAYGAGCAAGGSCSSAAPAPHTSSMTPPSAAKQARMPHAPPTPRTNSV